MTNNEYSHTCLSSLTITVHREDVSSHFLILFLLVFITHSLIHPHTQISMIHPNRNICIYVDTLVFTILLHKFIDTSFNFYFLCLVSHFQ